jgi:hypothetical protein
MQIETWNTEHYFHNDNKKLGNSCLTFDFPTLIEKMKQSQSWVKGDLNSIILLKSPEKQILLTVLHYGTIINSFQSKDSITLQVIEGKLEFHSDKDFVTLNEGQLLTLDDKINYSLATEEDTVFLLTVKTSFLREKKRKGAGSFIN